VVKRREFVCVATVNRDGEGTYLKDETGGRRFWPVGVGKCDTDALAADRAQLFAEAVVAFRAGDHWHIKDPNLLGVAASEVTGRTVKNPWIEHVATYLELNPKTGDVKGGDIFWSVTGRKHTSKDTTDMRHIANVLKSFGYVLKTLTAGNVWRLPTAETMDPDGP
ncbi:VapE domain-containing protein, partial [Paraburkholderia sp. BR14261]